MLTEQGVMTTEVIFNDYKTERYLLRKIWDEDKPLVSLIMTNPSSANAVTIDMTVHYSISNLYKLGYGGVDILNMTSNISPKIDTKNDISLTATNVEHILKSAEKSDKVIIAWGKIGENVKKIKQVQLQLLDKLKPFQDKMYMIASKSGESAFHPLAPQIRFDWVLKKFVMPDYLNAVTADRPENQAQSKPDEILEGEPGKTAKDKKSRNIQST